MRREKHIEEMANTINEMDEPNAHYYDEEFAKMIMRYKKGDEGK